ncbi:mitogen-activated protein kinase kinase [Musa troglodytarum]|uniref:Mitogen-activated protein kinase kinase n=1 Tax=Musa troglodytarum TaxID=320322 RepID=A0A9E7HJN0_9LILI|nr:mitogen-activated protein kinase kinase [Musa troglodytarum]
MDGGSLEGRRRPPGPRGARLSPPQEDRAPRHQALQPPHRLRRPRQDRRLRRQPDPGADHGPLQLLRRHHRVHESRADQHRSQSRALRRLRRRHLELRPQHPRVLPRPLPLRRQHRAAGGLGIAHVRHLLRRCTGGAAHRLPRVPELHLLLPAEGSGAAPPRGAAPPAPVHHQQPPLLDILHPPMIQHGIQEAGGQCKRCHFYPTVLAV